ncbi:MAG: hypothetical protein ACYSWQ_30265 [Planctomycetota bacterium]|jgi:hypothetical protein
MVLSVVSCLSMQAGVLKGEITDDELQMIRKAVPKTATAKPIKPRKLLVFNRAKGLIHTSIPYATKAIQLMAEKTGAFEVVTRKASNRSMRFVSTTRTGWISLIRRNARA